MIETKDSNRSLVIPKWLSFARLSNSAEISFPRKNKFVINEKTKINFFKDLNDFRKNPQKTIALDLLSSAIVLNELDVANEVAKYLELYKDIHPAIIKIVKKILYNKVEDKQINDLNSSIADVRTFLKKYPKNPLFWIELARLYTIKGNIKKAEKAVITALNLSPYERYIVRSAFRYFIHVDKIDKAIYYSKKAADYTSDPWLRTLYINGIILDDFKLSQIKKINIKLIPQNLLFHYSELIESHGMVELKLGNDKKAKKHFKLAWLAPSENVVAHGEWIIRNRFPLLSTSSNLDFSKSFEASTWRNFYDLALDEAIISARQWCLEEPYSTHPFMSGSSISCHAGKFKEAIIFAREGLSANPKDLSLKNNLAFAYLSNNQLVEAEKILSTFPKQLSDHEQIFFLATKGLLAFKKMNVLEGRKLYSQSIQLCNKHRDKRLSIKALLHLTLAEIEVQSQESIDLAKKAIRLTKDLDYPDIKLPKLKIENYLNKTNNKTNNLFSY